MGGGSSKRYKQSLPLNGIPSRRDLGQKALLFPEQVNSIEESISMSVNVNAMRYAELDTESKDLLIEAFGDLFMLEGEDYNSLKTNLLLQACTRESSPQDSILMREGDVGNKLYVVQSGHLEVSIEGDIVRHLTTGALVGEISLLYNAPRSATVRCLTPCSFFVLTREAFKQVQGIASSASLLRRSRWLQVAADMLSLGAVDISRLAGTLETQRFTKGERIYTENECSNRVYLIEEGIAELSSSDGSLAMMSPDDVQNSCGIVKPTPKVNRLTFTTKGLHKLPEHQTFSADQVVAALEDEGESDGSFKNSEIKFLEVQKGFLVGTGLIQFVHSGIDEKYMLKSTQGVGAMMPFSLTVTSDKMQCSYFTVETFEHMFGPNDVRAGNVFSSMNSPNSTATPKGRPSDSIDEGLRSDFTSFNSLDCTAEINRLMFISNETCLTKIPRRPLATQLEPEADIGDTGNTTPTRGSPTHEETTPVRRNRGGPRLDDEPRPGKVMRFCDESFIELCLLGKGAYGTVTYAKDVFKDIFYAIKRIHKADAKSSQHIRHIFDECKLLLLMKSPFVIHLQGLYVTVDDVVLVMDPILHGDLWGVIYEVNKHSRGLPVELIKFYSASIIMGLSHIHKKGIAFRDLKPENIMINSRGYLSLIDFGFAKKIPFLHVDPNGVKLIKMKSFTLCGTPDYLAPEFIFDAGMNHSVDIWALGVIIHEMIMLSTPFRPQRKSDLTALFVNIASVKKFGLKISTNIDYRTGDSRAYQLITQLLRAEPNERLGALNATIKITESPFFEDFPLKKLRMQHYQAPFIPDVFINIKQLKAKQSTKYVREKKAYNPTDLNQASQWEAFDSLVVKEM